MIVVIFGSSLFFVGNYYEFYKDWFEYWKVQGTGERVKGSRGEGVKGRGGEGY
jgi:hypothetical protein